MYHEHIIIARTEANERVYIYDLSVDFVEKKYNNKK